MAQGTQRRAKTENNVGKVLDALVKLTPLGGYEGAKFTSSKPFVELMGLPREEQRGLLVKVFAERMPRVAARIKPLKEAEDPVWRDQCNWVNLDDEDFLGLGRLGQRLFAKDLGLSGEDWAAIVGGVAKFKWIMPSFTHGYFEGMLSRLEKDFSRIERAPGLLRDLEKVKGAISGCTSRAADQRVVMRLEKLRKEGGQGERVVAKKPGPGAAQPAISEDQVRDIVDRFMRTVHAGSWRVSQIKDLSALSEVLKMGDADQCAVVTHIARRLAQIHKKQTAFFKSPGQSDSPWSKEHGLQLSLLLQRLLMRKLDLSAEQCDVLLSAVDTEDGTTWFTTPMIAAAVARGIERGVLRGDGLERARKVAQRLKSGHAKDAAKAGLKLEAAIKAAGPAAGGDGDPGLGELSAMDKVLLGKSELKPGGGPSLTDRMVEALVMPAEETKAAARFESGKFGSEQKSVEWINGLLEAQSAKYRGEPAEDRGTVKAVDELAALGMRGIAVAAAALGAMTQKSMKWTYDDARSQRFHNARDALQSIVPWAMKKTKDKDEEALGDVCDGLSRYRNAEFSRADWHDIAEPIVARLAAVKVDKLQAETMVQLLRFRERCGRGDSPRDRAVVAAFDEAAGIGRGLCVELGEPWVDRAYLDIRAMNGERGAAWPRLLEVCLEATSAQPTAKWNAKADAAIEGLRADEIQKRLADWLPLAGKARGAWPGGKVEGRDSSVPSDRAADVLRGLAWIAARYDNVKMAKALGDLAMAGYKMVPGVGARCIKPATAAVAGLAAMKNAEALAQLSRIRQLVKFGTAKKVLDSALSKLAAELKVTTDELHEMAAPDFGLERDGTMREEVGEFAMELRVVGDRAEIRVLEDGKERKSVPDSLKKDATLKEMKLVAADIDKMLPAQKDRLERLYHEQREWPAGVWRGRYIEQPLVGTLGRRLIWNFARGKAVQSGIWTEDGFVNAAAKGIEVADEDVVTLWHPALAKQDQVSAWREFLEKRELRQPFKQAHREVYLLTEAERRTRTYSNRFAAHIIKQNQLNALCQNRGWQHTLYVNDSGEPPILALPKWNLYAHYLVEPIGDDFFGSAGAYSYLQTDQVAFSRTARGENLPLAEVPALAFSEVMRDVDLFVGVCSVGNNPEWQDGGPEGRYRKYWWDYGFGELSGSGQSRKELLERLVPRLKIAGACEVETKFLKVKGKLRTYKIHLGSGNILMEPNDQYLCIVPGREQERKDVYLPFEGDRVLAIILSKAFMLAEDDKIWDSSISSQIKRKK